MERCPAGLVIVRRPFRAVKTSPWSAVTRHSFWSSAAGNDRWSVIIAAGARTANLHCGCRCWPLVPNRAGRAHRSESDDQSSHSKEGRPGPRVANHTECRPDTVEAKCREIFEVNLRDLESEFWEDVQKTIRASHNLLRPVDRGGPSL